MKKISDIRIIEYKYKSEKEREEHVETMESKGFFCSGQVKKSDDSITKENRNYYWYAKFMQEL